MVQNMAMTDSITPFKPYLLRAVYEWIEDNGLTTHILVDSTVKGIQAPMEYAQNGQIQFNIASRAIRSLSIDNDWVAFDARFSGNPFHVELPLTSVLAVFAVENGQGVAFNQEEPETTEKEQQNTESGSGAESGAPFLRIVK
jgi:stringent starvation protein B